VFGEYAQIVAFDAGPGSPSVLWHACCAYEYALDAITGRLGRGPEGPRVDQVISAILGVRKVAAEPATW